MNNEVKAGSFWSSCGVGLTWEKMGLGLGIHSQLEPLRGVFVLRMCSWYVRARNDVMCLGMHMDESSR